jgi:hypothetical protein
MLVTTQQWLGTTWTTSPTCGRSGHSVRSTVPCSSDRAVIPAAGYSSRCPYPGIPYWSEVSTLDPASMMARVGVGRLTTVARIRMAQSSQVAPPARTTMASL